MVEHGRDRRERLAVERCRRSIGIKRPRRLLDERLVDLRQWHRADARNDRLEVGPLAAGLEVAHGCADERRRRLRSKDTALDDLPLAPRPDRFGGLVVSNSCALAYADPSDGSEDVPVRAAGSSLELEGHSSASYRALMSERVNSLRPPRIR